MHSGRSDTAANANVNSDAPQNSLANFSQSQRKSCGSSAAKLIASGFANEIAKCSSSLYKFLANGRLRQNSLAIANATAWCTQVQTTSKPKRSFARSKRRSIRENFCDRRGCQTSQRKRLTSGEAWGTSGEPLGCC